MSATFFMSTADMPGQIGTPTNTLPLPDTAIARHLSGMAGFFD
jgi:hypothetical protein